jgi:hypothetical protein
LAVKQVAVDDKEKAVFVAEYTVVCPVSEEELKNLLEVMHVQLQVYLER